MGSDSLIPRKRLPTRGHWQTAEHALIDDRRQEAILTKLSGQRERDVRLRTSGFFASKTWIGSRSLQAMDNYGMRDEQEKCFHCRKALRTGATRAGRSPPSMQDVHMLVAYPCLVVRSVWNPTTTCVRSWITESVLAEMRTIRCIEHKGRLKFVTRLWATGGICKLRLRHTCWIARIHLQGKSKTLARHRPSSPKRDSEI